jgi:hypothetical protein
MCGELRVGSCVKCLLLCIMHIFVILSLLLTSVKHVVYNILTLSRPNFFLLSPHTYLWFLQHIKNVRSYPLTFTGHLLIIQYNSTLTVSTCKLYPHAESTAVVTSPLYASLMFLCHVTGTPHTVTCDVLLLRTCTI